MKIENGNRKNITYSTIVILIFVLLSEYQSVVLHLPPGHLPTPFLWHLPPPTFVHLPPGQLPPLNFFLIFHLFKRFKMTNFSLEVVMDEVLDM